MEYSILMRERERERERKRKEERTGLIPMSSPLTSMKRGIRRNLSLKDGRAD